jgi:DNA-binding NarL/FixJ family response regulator
MAEPVVVVVDDDPDCLEAIVDELAHRGLPARGYSSGEKLLLARDQLALAKVALVDLFLGEQQAFPLIRELRRLHPGLAVIALTGHSDDELVVRAIRAGAVGYVLKNDALGRLHEVVTTALEDGAPLTPSVARRLLQAFCEHEPAGEALTNREVDVLRALSRGHTYEGCASCLGISLDTVRAHVRRTYTKLQAASKAEAVAKAMRRGLLD